MNITFDIETVPCQHLGIRAELSADIKPPAVLKKAESIAEWERESRPGAVEEAWLRTSFDGGLGQIVVIGWAVDDGDIQSLQVADLSRVEEMRLLSEWFVMLRAAYSGTSGRPPCFVGHNSNAFDIPFVWKRAMVLGIKPPIWFPRDPKPWGESTFDTMTAWAGVRDRVSMDRLCRILGIPGKDGMDGSQVWPAVAEGRLDEVAAYCRADVWRTRKIFDRMNFREAP